MCNQEWRGQENIAELLEEEQAKRRLIVYGFILAIILILSIYSIYLIIKGWF